MKLKCGSQGLAQKTIQGIDCGFHIFSCIPFWQSVLYASNLCVLRNGHFPEDFFKSTVNTWSTQVQAYSSSSFCKWEWRSRNFCFEWKRKHTLSRWHYKQQLCCYCFNVSTSILIIQLVLGILFFNNNYVGDAYELINYLI